MLEKIREGSQGPVAKIILGAVILSFALAGIGSYLGQTTEQPVEVQYQAMVSRHHRPDGADGARAVRRGHAGGARGAVPAHELRRGHAPLR